MNERKKASPTPAEKVGSGLPSVAVPSNHLPFTVKSILAVTGLIILCTGAFMVIQGEASVELQRLSNEVQPSEANIVTADDQDLGNMNIPEGYYPKSGECTYMFGNPLGRIVLNKDNGWRGTALSPSDRKTEMVSIVMERAKEKVNTLSMCRTGVQYHEKCFILSKWRLVEQETVIWKTKDLTKFGEKKDEQEYTFLLCHSWGLYDEILKFVAPKWKDKNIPHGTTACVYYGGGESSIVVLNEGNKWKSELTYLQEVHTLSMSSVGGQVCFKKEVHQRYIRSYIGTTRYFLSNDDKKHLLIWNLEQEEYVVCTVDGDTNGMYVRLLIQIPK